MSTTTQSNVMLVNPGIFVIEVMTLVYTWPMFAPRSAHDVSDGQLVEVLIVVWSYILNSQ